MYELIESVFGDMTILGSSRHRQAKQRLEYKINTCYDPIKAFMSSYIYV